MAFLLTFRALFDQDGELDLGHIQQQCSGRIEKAFYYDCTDEKKSRSFLKKLG